jgi:hypothetical protein
MYVLFVPAIAYSGRPQGIGIRDVLSVVGAQLVSALSAACMGFALRFLTLENVPPIQRMAILIVVYLAVLILVVGFFKVIAPLRVSLASQRPPAPTVDVAY